MACASVAEKKRGISRDIGSLKITRPELSSSTPSVTINFETLSGKNRTSGFRVEDVHEAIRFLQNEHDKVLTGLHKQIESLQRKCDDLQFETHIRQITSREENSSRKNLQEMSTKLEERTTQVEEYKNLLEEEKQRFKWREVQLLQQIEVNDQSKAEMKSEIEKLKSQVHDLQIYCSGIRSSEANRPHSTLSRNRNSPRVQIKSLVQTPTANQQNHRSSQESLDSVTNKSINSEDGVETVFWNSRLSSYSSNRIAKRGSRVQSSSAVVSPCNSQVVSLPPVISGDGSSRSDSGSLILPPISQSQSITRPHIRKQLRLFSAPNLDSNANLSSPRATKKPP